MIAGATVAGMERENEVIVDFLRHWVGSYFDREPPIADVAALESFLDRHAAFIVQKCIYEYARARSGTMSMALFKEEAFLNAIDVSRWKNFPIGLGNVTEMVLNTMRPHAGDRQALLTDRLIGLAISVTERYPVPDGFPDRFWADARIELDARLRRAALAEPKPVKDVPKPTIQAFFDQLPIHENLRGHDFQLVQNNIRINLCRSYEVFIEQLDAAALIADLFADRPSVALPAGQGAG